MTWILNIYFGSHSISSDIPVAYFFFGLLVLSFFCICFMFHIVELAVVHQGLKVIGQDLMIVRVTVEVQEPPLGSMLTREELQLNTNLLLG